MDTLRPGHCHPPPCLGSWPHVRWQPSVFCGRPRTHCTNTNHTAMTRKTLEVFFRFDNHLKKNGMPLPTLSYKERNLSKHQ